MPHLYTRDIKYLAMFKDWIKIQRGLDCRSGYCIAETIITSTYVMELLRVYEDSYYKNSVPLSTLRHVVDSSS